MEIRQRRTNSQQGTWMSRPLLWIAGAQSQQRVLENSRHSACQNYPTQGQESWGIYISTPVRYYLSLLWGWGGNFPAVLPAALGHSGLWIPEKAPRKRERGAGSWESVPTFQRWLSGEDSGPGCPFSCPNTGTFNAWPGEASPWRAQAADLVLTHHQK